MPGLQFRKVLPILQTLLAGSFGGQGLWERSYSLSHAVLGWSSTAVYHVWPWPYKFAAVLNMPAFLAGTLIAWPISEVWPTLSEIVLFSPTLLFVALLWYYIGRHIDRIESATASRKALRAATLWTSILVFMGVSAGLAYLHTSYTSYLLYGVLLWSVVGLCILTLRGMSWKKKRRRRIAV